MHHDGRVLQHRDDTSMHTLTFSNILLHYSSTATCTRVLSVACILLQHRYAYIDIYEVYYYNSSQHKVHLRERRLRIFPVVALEDR